MDLGFQQNSVNLLRIPLDTELANTAKSLDELSVVVCICDPNDQEAGTGKA